MDPLSPILGINDPTFTYDAYLPSMDTSDEDPLSLDVDIDYLAEESSTSTTATDRRHPQPPSLDLSSPLSTSVSTSNPPPFISSQAPPQALVPQMGLVVRGGYGSGRGAEGSVVSPGGSGGLSTGSGSTGSRQRLERKGHTKSRRGCYNCKRRRIKCQETKPACGHCVKSGLKCEYPSMPTVIHQPQHQIPLFTLQDMRFFQHFLIRGFPSHPIGADHIWRHVVPCLSEQYEYLMHAILGLAASELMRDDASLVTAAMEHRVKAIRAVKRALADAPNANTFEEGNALMATCFALTFQSVLLDDGMVEYMSFIRGILIVAIQMYVKGAKLIFGQFLGDASKDALQPYMEALPLINQSWVDGADDAIQALRPLCENEIEIKYWELLLEMTAQLRVSSWEGYLAMGRHYGWWMMLPHDQFQSIIDPTRQTVVLLATHWIALKQTMAIITDTETKASKERESSGGSGDGTNIGPGLIKWLHHLNRLVDAEHAQFNTWPMWVEAELARDPAAFGKSVA